MRQRIVSLFDFPSEVRLATYSEVLPSYFIHTIHGFDFDYPDVARRLKSAADRLARLNFVD